MANYFKDCKTAEDGKQLYRKLAKELHPDNPNGSAEKFKDLQNQFESFWKMYKDIHYSEKTGTTYKSRTETKETAKDFMDILEKLSSVHGLELEICGTWLWISGNTYPNREYLKECGCGWSKGKKKWYWTKEEFTKDKHFKSPSMNVIRMKYGSEKVNQSFKPELE